MQICFFNEKKKRNMDNNTALLIILWCDYFGENHTRLQRNGMRILQQNVSGIKHALKIKLQNLNSENFVTKKSSGQGGE